MMLLCSKTFENHQKLLEKIFSSILKPLYDLLKVENDLLEIKAPNTKGKQQKYWQLDPGV